MSNVATFGWGGTASVATFGWGKSEGEIPPTPPIPILVVHGGGGVNLQEVAEEELERKVSIIPLTESLIVEESGVIDLRPATLQLQLDKVKSVLAQITEKEKEVKKVLEEMQDVSEQFDALYEYKKIKLEHILDVVLKEKKELAEEKKAFLEEQVKIKNWGRVKGISELENIRLFDPSMWRIKEWADELEEPIEEVKERVVYVMPQQKQSDWTPERVGKVAIGVVSTVAFFYILYKLLQSDKLLQPDKKKHARRRRNVRH
jgi:hypothetical protein